MPIQNRLMLGLGLGLGLLLLGSAHAAPVVDSEALKAWIDANSFELPIDPVEPPVEPPVVALPPSIVYDTGKLSIRPDPSISANTIALDGGVTLQITTTGDAQVKKGDLVVWHSNTQATCSPTNCSFTFVSDGTLVVYGPTGAGLWSSKTWGHHNAKLTFKNIEPYLSIKDGATELWNSGTAVVVVPPPVDSSNPQPAIPGASGWKLAFRDEFTDLSISNSVTYDGKRWYTKTEPCCVPGGNPGFKVYPNVVAPTTVEQANPFSIVDGALRIRLQKINNVWYGAGISTVDRENQRGFAQKYGYWEARLKLPKGPGVWPAWWALSQSRYGPPDVNGMYTQNGELDFMELWGGEQNGGVGPAYYINLHDWGANPDQHPWNAKVKPGYDFYSNYHTYGMEWTEQKMTFWFDHEKIGETTTPSRFKEAYWAVLDMGIGGGWPTEGTPNPSDMMVDWVRIWTR